MLVVCAKQFKSVRPCHRGKKSDPDNFTHQKFCCAKYLGGQRITEKSFTLIELIVVIAIITIVSGIVLANFRHGERAGDLSGAKQKLMVSLRQAQALALSPKKYGGDIPYGFGVYVKNNQEWLLFYNPSSYPQVFYSSANSRVIEAGQIKAGVNLTPNPFAIFFLPPDAKTYLNGLASGSQVFTIANSTGNETVTLYASGRIE